MINTVPSLIDGNLENIEFKIIRILITGPENRVIRALRPIFHLTKPSMYRFCRFIDRLREKAPAS